MDEGATNTHWTEGTLCDDAPTPERPWLQLLAVVILVALIDALLGFGLARRAGPLHEARVADVADEPVTRTSLRASLQAAVDDPGRPILLIGDSVLAGDVLAPLRDDWQDQRILDHLRRELGPASEVSFHQIALDGLLPIDVLHLIAELDRLDPEGRVEVVVELNLRYFSGQYAKQDECTRPAICSLGDSALGDSGTLIRSLFGLGEAGTIAHDWLLARTPIHRFRDSLDRPPALDRVAGMTVALADERTRPSDREALARVSEHYRSSKVGKGEQADALDRLLVRLHGRRPATLFLTPLAPGFVKSTLPGNERLRRYSELATAIADVAATPGHPLELISLDHPLFVDEHFVDHVHLQPEGNRLLAINLLHRLGLPLARRPRIGQMIEGEDHDRSLVHRTDWGWADGSAWTVLFDHPEGVAVRRDGSEVVIADTNNHALRRLRGGMDFVERLAGQPRRPGQRDGSAHMAKLELPRDPELLDDEVWFIDGADQDRLRVLDHGYVRSVGWRGVRCSSFQRISGFDPPGPAPATRLFVLCRDHRVLALDLATREASVFVRPELDDRFVAIEALPDGSLILADAAGRLWSVDPSRAEPRSLLFANTGKEVLPTGGYPFAFDRVHFQKLVEIEWVERYGALLVADEVAPITESQRLQRELTERVHLRLLDFETEQMWPWVKPIPHGDAWHLWGKQTQMYATWYHQGSFAIAQDDASLVWLERDRSRLLRLADGLLGLAKLGNLRSAVAKVELLDPIGASAPRKILAERRPDRWLDLRHEPRPHAGPYVMVMIGSSLTALSDRIGNYSLGRRLEVELQRELGYRDRLRVDLFQRSVQSGGLTRRVDELERFLADGPAVDVVLIELHQLEAEFEAPGGEALVEAQLDRLRALVEPHDALIVLFDDTAMASLGRDGLRASSPTMHAVIEQARAQGLWVLEPSDRLLRELLVDSPWGNQPWALGQIHGAPWAIDRTAELLTSMMAPRLREFLRERVPARRRPLAQQVNDE
ncbi:hypothetical protein ACNOYE_04505 [Nannocystaceae bacterium ST9]